MHETTERRVKRTKGMTVTERGRQAQFCQYYMNPKSETFRQLAPSLLAAGYSEEEMQPKLRSKRWLYQLIDMWNERAAQSMHEIDATWVGKQLIKESAGERAQDRIRALELLGKWKGMFVDRMEVTEGKKLIVIDGDPKDQGPAPLLPEAGGSTGGDQAL